MSTKPSDTTAEVTTSDDEMDEEEKYRVLLERTLSEFAKSIALTEADHLHHFLLKKQLQALVDIAFGANISRIFTFGSAESSLGERYSDVDVSVNIKPQELAKALNKSSNEVWVLASEAVQHLCGLVTKNRHDFFYFDVQQEISKAKVPVITLSNLYGIHIDVTFCNELPIHNTRLLKKYASLDQRVRTLVLCVKRWAKIMGVSDAKNGNLSSYSWTLLCIYFLQVKENPLLPCLQQDVASSQIACKYTRRTYNIGFRDGDDVHALDCSDTVSELLYGFFRFYSKNFRWGQEVVSIRNGQRLNYFSPDGTQRAMEFESLLPGRGDPLKDIHIEDPFELSRNLNCVMSEDGRIRLREAFEQAFKMISDQGSDTGIVSSKKLFKLARTLTKERDKPLIQFKSHADNSLEQYPLASYVLEGETVEMW